jgi:hypothetical protein
MTRPKIDRGIARVGLLVGGLLAFAAWQTPAHAVMVTPNNSPGEPNLYTVMNNLYGVGNWAQVDDSLIQTATNVGQTVGVTFDARYAADNLTYGYWKDNTTFISQMSVTKAGAVPVSLIVSGSQLTTSLGGIFSNGLRDDTTGALFSSDKTKNADGLAHVIEFTILNNPNMGVMAWEDTVGGDYDYQDLILQYVIDFHPTMPVPEPATMSLFGAALLLAGGARRYLRSKKPGTAS